MRILVIGGSGHIGTYLVPYLVESGHEVLCMTRGKRAPYTGAPAWAKVQRIECDRKAEEKAGTFGVRVLELKADAVVDLISFKLESVRHLAEALRGKVRHYLQCGSLWVNGPLEVAPTPDAFPRKPVGEYGIQKAAIEDYLLDEARRGRFPATVLHPGHISGPGWMPINPAGNVNPEVFEKLAAGAELALPDTGLGLLHHVHAADVAQSFWRSLENWSAAVGESFHVASPQAVTLRGLSAGVANWFGHEAKLVFLPFEQWKKTVSEDDANCTWDHISRSPCASIEKARARLGYAPRYTSLQAIREALAWLIANGKVKAERLD